MGEKRALTKSEERILAALAGMCCQYIEHDGVVDHMCMGAGEMATAILASYGLLEMDSEGGRFGRWTPAGEALLDAY